MGNSIYLDGLTKEEYDALSKKLWEIQDHKCFICGEEIDLDLHVTNVDHIKPLVNGGKDDETNFAITHEHCNKSKQDADLEVARVLSRLSKIIKDAEAKNETPSLKHVLLAYDGSKHDFSFKIEATRSSILSVSLEILRSTLQTYSLISCLERRQRS
jgi:HNH endonuclease.